MQTRDLQNIINRKEIARGGRIKRVEMRYLAKMSGDLSAFSSYQISPHLPPLISQWRMRSRVGIPRLLPGTFNRLHAEKKRYPSERRKGGFSKFSCSFLCTVRNCASSFTHSACSFSLSFLIFVMIRVRE